MAEEIVPHAEPIAQTGEAEWFPPAEDDNEGHLAGEPGRRKGFFFGRGGLKWGLAIAFFLLCAAALIVVVVTGLVLVHALRVGGEAHAVRPWSSALIEAAQFAGVLLATLLLARIERRRVGRYGLGTPVGRVGQIAAGGAWGLVLLSVLVGVLWKTGVLVLSAPELHGVDAVRWGAAWMVPFALTGLFEELAFRGPLQFTLTRGLAGLLRGERTPAHRKAFGFWMAAVLLSLLFGGLHLQNRGEAATGAAAAALVALMFSFSLWRTGSLWWAVGFHAAWDWAESFLYGTSDSGVVALHTFLRGRPQGSALLSGGTVGPEGSVWVVPVIALAAVVVAVTLPSQAGSPSDPAYLPDA